MVEYIWQKEAEEKFSSEWKKYLEYRVEEQKKGKVISFNEWKEKYLKEGEKEGKEEEIK